MLTVPLVLAVFSAGLIGGLHCIGMCGALSVMLSGKSKKKTDSHIPIIPIHQTKEISRPKNKWLVFQLHAGRLFTYMLIGALFGWLGAASFGLQQFISVHLLWFVLGNLALVLLGLHLLGLRWTHFLPNMLLLPMRSFAKFITPSTEKIQRFPFLVGMAWGALPCGLLFGIAPFAIFSGQAWSGAVLMLIFGLTALPHLLLSYGMITYIQKNPAMKIFKITIAASLIAIGLLGFWYADMKNMPEFLCIIPQ